MSSGFLGSLWATIAPASGANTEQNGIPTSRSAQSAVDDENQSEREEDNPSSENTPTATAQHVQLNVPSFSLTEDSTSAVTQEGSRPSLPPSSEAETQPPTHTRSQQPIHNSNKTSTSAGMLDVMMPPPPAPRIARNQTSSASAQSSLRIPSTGPLPNRGPPANSQQRAGTSGSRGKVLLAPGHSPMDWAALTKSSNLSGVSSFQRVTPSQMKVMNGRKGKPIWSSWQGKVYNITPYLPYHPGGEKELMKAAGRDATKLFMDIHPWVNWENMLSACLVGVLVSEEEPKESSLDAID